MMRISINNKELEAYDQVVSEYYKERTHGVRTENWSQ